MTHLRRSSLGHLMVDSTARHLMNDSYCSRFKNTTVEFALRLRDCRYPSTDCTGVGYGGAGGSTNIRNGTYSFYGCGNGCCIWTGTNLATFGYWTADCQDIYTTSFTSTDYVLCAYDCNLQKWTLEFYSSPLTTIVCPGNPPVGGESFDPSYGWDAQTCNGVEDRKSVV